MEENLDIKEKFIGVKVKGMNLFVYFGGDMYSLTESPTTVLLRTTKDEFIKSIDGEETGLFEEIRDALEEIRDCTNEECLLLKDVDIHTLDFEFFEMETVWRVIK